jgi:hypothetical protein
MEEAKILCQTPTPGKQPTRIPQWKYNAVWQAILQAVPEDEPGIRFADLAGEVEKLLPTKDRHELGSVGWHTTVVKLDMEVKGEILRLPGSNPQRLVRNRSVSRAAE